MKKHKPVATEETRKKLKESFQKLRQQDSTPFNKEDYQNSDQEKKE
jgi:hypothetical protein